MASKILRLWPCRLGHKAIAAASLCALLVGCAEFTHRGGVVAQIADKILFPASAKSHRVLRAYVVMASLVTIANNRGIPSGDKMAFNGRIIQTMDAIKEAFICAYGTRSGCVFFDEKMARVDYNLYKLALTVLVTSESRALITQLQAELLPKVPVVGSTLAAASSAAQAAGQVATAGVETTQIVENLIKLGYDAGTTVAPLFPLYRDAQELDMVVVVDMLARRCAHDTGHFSSIPQNKNSFTQNVDDYFDAHALPQTAECAHFVEGLRLYKDGNGDLESWRQFTNAMNAIYLADMTPSADHFLEVSSMVTASCEQISDILGTSQTGKTSTKGTTVCASVLLFTGKTGYEPLDTAEASAMALAYHGKSVQGSASVSGSNAAPNAKATLSAKPLN